MMLFGIALTLLSFGMTIADLSDGEYHGAEINLSGVQFIVGTPFIVIGTLIWWGGWALRRKAARGAPDTDPGSPPRGV